MKKVVMSIVVVFLTVVSIYGANNSDVASYGFSYIVNDAEKVEKNYKSSEVVNIDLNTGDQVALYIPANATTGYQWVLKDNFEAKVVQLISTEYKAPNSELMGAGGTSIWTFKANEKGVATLVFEYIRPWEKDVEPEIVLLIQVHVKEK